VLRLPGVRETVNLTHIKAGYYSIKALNPSGIVPAGPEHVAELMASIN
jgi:glutathionyl-hydroquinone reductase